jgi:photosystem II stability/assembly factor-like uncharacterized protein
MRRIVLLSWLCFSLAIASAAAPPAGGREPSAPAKTEEKGPWSPKTFSGLELRSIGPAFMSGRIMDFAVDPANPSRYFVAAASGGVWKTVNAGTTWTPVFDKEGSYSIGCITLDPKNPNVVWVGTGEHNSQRSVGYGDGIYRSEDGGRSWENLGLKASEHIAKILIDPRDSKVVYAACQGPLWAPGGDRGLYKTTDGGKTWKAVLTISENTGVTDLAMDPRDPDVLYAAAYQRRRHVYTVINGGPESALYKSTDGGANWKKLTSGLPEVEMGRIGIALSPADPDVLYAIIEAAEKKGGFFRSADRGATWEKRSDYVSGSGQYYQEPYADPKNPDRVYVVDVTLKVTEDGGKTVRRAGEKWKHVDNHGVWIDPRDTDHLLVGCDGGVYETWDRCKNWDFKANLPITQFYRVTVDNSKPIYYVYGGTQDNASQGGPSRTTSASGIVNSDWFVTHGGDGFVTVVDPEDPNILYAESQHGVLARYDRRSGEELDIQPQPGKGEMGYRWNWDSPLLISPHAHTRLYFAAERLFRSDDRGDTWRAISGDLTRQLDRNKLPVMGKVWPADAVAKSASTSLFGNIVSLSESPLKEGQLAVGTDDGLVQVTTDGGASWTRFDRFPGVPDMSYVSDLAWSGHDAATLYAAFDNHKQGDFKPYVLKSADSGKTWTSIAGDLPERGTVYVLLEDAARRDLLFAGTEFGLFFTVDGGRRWVRLKGNFPTIAVKDLALQTREGDLAVATFGRSFYILDDITPLRKVDDTTLAAPAALFPVKDALAFVERYPLGGRGPADQGASFFTAPNPPFGAVFTYYLKEDLKTRKEKRHEAEQEAEKRKVSPPYPTAEELRAEALEEEPTLVLTVTDEAGHTVRRLTAPPKAGIHRMAWDLHYAPSLPVKEEPSRDQDYEREPDRGPMAAPGTYQVSLAQRVDGVTTQLAGPVAFKVVSLGLQTLEAPDRAALLAFQQKTARLQRAVLGAVEAARDAQTRAKLIEKALLDTPGSDPALMDQARALLIKLDASLLALRGDRVLRERNDNSAPGIVDRVDRVVEGSWSATTAPTQTQRDQLATASQLFAEELPKLRTLVEVDLKRLENAAEKAGAPWTPGRLPDWTPEL